MMMQEQPIVRAKLDHANYTVADTPYEFSTSMTLTGDQLEKIRASGHGMHIPLSQVIDEPDKVEDRIKRKIGFNYSLDDYKKTPLNFILLDASVTGIKSPDANGSMMIGGAIALPAVHGATFPYEDLTPDGRYRKILPYRLGTNFVNGNEYAFSHTLAHNNVDNEYPLISRGTAISPRIIFPSGETEGTGGVLPEDDDKLVEHAKRHLVLHGHTINENNVYPPNLRPTISEVLSADSRAGGAVKSQHLVALKNGSFPVAWYAKEQDQKFHRDEGVVAPIDDFTYRTFHFMDSCNESRSTNFKDCNIWWDVDHLKSVPKVKAKLKFKILPIVPFHEQKGKVFIPYQNMVKHLRSTLKTVDKPFI
jgi:hypothetical protein